MIRPLSALVLAAAIGGAELVCSGVIGQSQPPSATPIASVGFAGVVVAADRVWAVSGRCLLGFTADADGGGTVAASLELPAGAVANAGLWRLQDRLLVQLADRRLAVVDPAGPAVERMLPLPDGTTRIFCREDGGEGPPVLVLAGRQVFGLRLDGAAPQRLIELPALAGAGWQAIGVDGDGAILAGASYPDQRQYRFAAGDGSQTVGSGWPRRGQAVLQYLRAGGTTWALRANGAITRPEADGADGGGPERGTARQAWNNYSTGFFPIPGGWWLASSQGLLRLGGDGRVLARLGGTPEIRACSLSRDGEIMALIEGGQRILRFPLDATATTAPASAGNEPWRIGRGWTAKAPGLVPDPPGYLVLDEVAGRLWTFEQPGSAPNTTREWIPRTQAGTFTAPRALAGGDILVRVLDGDRVREADRRSDPPAFRDAGLVFPAGFACRCLAAEDDARLFAASATTVIRFDRGAGGAYAPAWSATLGTDIAAVAVTGGHLLLADPGAGAVVLVDAGSGAALATLRAADAPGGRLSPVAVAARQPWAVVADRAGSRLLRLRIK